MKSVPTLNELFDQVGLSLPEYLAKKNKEEKVSEPTFIVESPETEDPDEKPNEKSKK